MINSEENAEFSLSFLLSFAKNTIIELYSASKVSSMVEYLRSISLSTQIYSIFIGIIAIYIVVNTIFRFEYYLRIFNPRDTGDVFYYIMIENLLKKQNNIIIYFEETNYLLNLKLAVLVNDYTSIYLTELGRNGFFYDLSMSNLTKDIYQDYNPNIHLKDTYNSSSNYSISQDDLNKNLNNYFEYKSDGKKFYYKEVAKLFYLYQPLATNLFALNNIAIETNYLIAYPIRKKILEAGLNNITSLKSSSETYNKNMTLYFQYPLNSMITDSYDNINFVPYDFSTDPIPFLYYSDYNTELISRNWFNNYERMNLQLDRDHYEATIMVLKEENDKFFYYKSLWKMFRVEIEDFYMYISLVSQVDVDKSEDIPRLINSNFTDKLDYFTILNNNPKTSINVNKMDYWKADGVNNYDINCEKNIVIKTPDYFTSLFRYGMTNLVNHRNVDNINLSLIKMYLMQNLTTFFSINEIFKRDSYFLTLIFYMNIYHNLDLTCKHQRNRTNLETIFGFTDIRVKDTVNPDDTVYGNDTSFTHMSKINTQFQNNVTKYFQTSYNEKYCSINTTIIFCNYINITDYYFKIKSLGIDCFSNLNLYVPDDNFKSMDSLDCFCTLFKCLDTQDYDYISRFLENPKEIQLTKESLNISIDCKLQLTSMQKEQNETFRMRYSYLNDTGVSGDNTFQFFVFSNETKINSIYNEYLNEVNSIIHYVVTIYNGVVLITISFIIYLLYLSSEKVVAKVNLVAESKFINQIDQDESEEIIRFSQPSREEDSKSPENEAIKTPINRRRSMLINSNYPILNKVNKKPVGIDKMRTIKEAEESDNEEEKRLTKGNEPKEDKTVPINPILRFMDNRREFVRGREDHNVNNSAASENSNNMLTGGNRDHKHHEEANSEHRSVNEEAPENNQQMNIGKGLQRASVIINAKRRKSAWVEEEYEKDELDDILDLISSNNHHFSININFEKIFFRESKKHCFYNQIFIEKLKLYEFFNKRTLGENIDKIYKYEPDKCDINIVFEFYQLESFNIDYNGKNFLFKYDDFLPRSTTDIYNEKISEKRGELFNRIGQHIEDIYYEEAEMNDFLRKDRFQSAVNYYVDNVVHKWLNAIYDYQKKIFSQNKQLDKKD